MKLFSTVLLALISQAVYAYEVGYEVEVIIFENASDYYAKSEQWALIEDPETLITDSNEPVEEAAAQEQKTVENAKSETAKKPFYEDIPVEKYSLMEQLNKLDNHPDYRVLMHKAWKQQGLDRDKAFPVSFNSREFIMPVINEEKAETAAEANENNEILKENKSSFIEGEFKLIMSRYLHVEANLVLHRPVDSTLVYTDTDASEPSYEKYPVIFERRMRSKEIHFIDHPLVGMIVLAKPFKILTEEDEKAPVTETYRTL